MRRDGGRGETRPGLTRGRVARCRAVRRPSRCAWTTTAGHVRALADPAGPGAADAHAYSAERRTGHTCAARYVHAAPDRRLGRSPRAHRSRRCGSDDDTGGKARDTSSRQQATGGDAPPSSSPSWTARQLEVAAVWTGPEQKNFKKVLEEFEKRTGAKVTFVPDAATTIVHLPRHEDRRAARRRTWRCCRRSACSSSPRKKGWLKPLGAEAKAAADQELLRRAGRTSAPSRASSTASTSRPPTSRWSGTTPRPSRTRASPEPEDLEGLPRHGRRPSPTPAHPPSRSAARTAGRSPTGSRTSTCRRRARRSTTSSPSTRSSGPTPRSRRR